MAVKDHSLDDKIINAAREEFMLLGFRRASLREIARKAGITTGALYTRYKNKDDLFSSLVKDALSKIAVNYEPMKKNYYQAQATGSAEALLKVIKAEEQVYLDFMLQYYDECILFFCRSEGSSVELMMEKMMDSKAKETVAFLKTMAKREFDSRGIEFIMAEQFNYYRKVLQKTSGKDEAFQCIKALEQFLDAGWKDLLERIL